jgi:uncharacterized protein DUF6585
MFCNRGAIWRQRNIRKPPSSRQRLIRLLKGICDQAMTGKPKPLADYDAQALPEGLRAYGRPLAIHRPWNAVVEDVRLKLISKLFGGSQGFSGAAVERWALIIVGAVLLALGLLAIGFYFFRPPKDQNPVFLLVIALLAFGLGGASFAAGIFHEWFSALQEGFSKAQLAPRIVAARIYVVYDEGLAAVEGDAVEFMPWREVSEVCTTSAGLNRIFTVSGADGRKIDIPPGVTEAGELRLAIQQRVNEILLPRALAKIEAGKSAKFGPFAVSKRGLKYKDRSAIWDDVKSIEIQSGRGGRRLTIYCEGRLLAWCWCDLDSVPNHQTLYDVICRTAPEQLLTRSTRPRW